MKAVIITAVLCLCQSLLAQSKQEGSATASQQKQADTAVFGVQLGEKLSLPECKRTKYPDPPIHQYYDVVNTSPVRCFERWDADTTKFGAPLGTTTITIQFPFNDEPQIVVPIHAVSGQAIDGNLESVTVETCGIECQDAALATLREKYGEPSGLKEENKENGFGAVFASHSAEWLQFANLTVIFQGTTGRLDEGLISILTNKGLEFKNKQQTPVGPKL